MITHPHPEWSRLARADAIEARQREYHGAPCVTDPAHILSDGTTIRYTSGAQCRPCAVIRNRKKAQGKRAVHMTRIGAAFIGEPCANGHDGTRYKSNHKCIFCHQPTIGLKYRPIDDLAPPKPRNRVPDNGWPFPDRFEDHPNPVAGVYVKNLRHLPLQVGTWGVPA